MTAEVVFSALDSGAAGDAEPAFASAGKTVLTNAKNYRMDPDVPLVIAEVNPSHLDVLAAQRKNRGWSGAIVANGNCASIIAALPLAPIHEKFGITKLVAMTMQAVSGAGYPGVASLDILGNVIPYIKDEEPKIEEEIQKFLGRADGSVVQSAAFPVSAHANRVAVEHGHTVCMSIELDVEGQRGRGRAGDRRVARCRGRAEAAERARACAPASRPSPIVRSRAARSTRAAG